MITNATILRIDTPSAPNAAGVRTLVEGPAISVRAALTMPTVLQLRTLGLSGTAVTGALYVLKSATATAFATGQMITVLSNVLVEGCKFLGTSLEINAGSGDITARDCSFAIDFPDPNAGVGACINLQGQDNSHGWRRAIRGVMIESCKAVTTTRMARFMAIRGPLAEGVVLRGNVFTAPNMVTGGHGVSILSAPSPEAIKESTGNVWPDARADGWANGGVFNLGPDGTGTGHGFWSKAMWMKLPGVSGDTFR